MKAFKDPLGKVIFCGTCQKSRLVGLPTPCSPCLTSISTFLGVYPQKPSYMTFVLETVPGSWPALRPHTDQWDQMLRCPESGREERQLPGVAGSPFPWSNPNLPLP
jgi:hypothetical protein